MDKDNDVYYKKMWEEENSDIVEQIKSQLTNATTVKEKLALQRKLNDNLPIEINDIELWTEDIGYIIDNKKIEKEKRKAGIERQNCQKFCCW